MKELNKILNCDCLDGLKKLEENSIHCCVTSPPYYGLRDYGTAKWDGGDENCNHKGYELAGKPGSDKQDSNMGANYVSIGDCIKCGAVRIDRQMGLEKTPEEYVEKMVAVFREVKRVLKKDGTLWLNLGDSYASNSKGTGGTHYPDGRPYKQTTNAGSRYGAMKFNHGVKEKDLIGIPWMVAFALRADGWYLRQDIIWHKPNPMPESVTDRCTKSHEYIFLLSKSAKYYYDGESVKTKSLDMRTAYRPFQDNVYEDMGKKRQCLNPKFSDTVYENANKRSVWTVNTYPYPEAHFATFPEDLIVDMIKAGCPENGIVLDPFMGAGTTALVASKLNRNFIGFELNADYIKIAEKRLRDELGMFNKAQ